MTNFIIHFLLCNITISGIIVLLLMVRKILTNKITNRCLYHLWFLLLGFLTVPFLPLKSTPALSLFSWLNSIVNSFIPNSGKSVSLTADSTLSAGTNWINDFTLSVRQETSSLAAMLLTGIWAIGIFVMILLLIRSALRLNTLKKSALPLQNQDVYQLYKSCLAESNITKTIPVYSTAFLTSPIIVGICKPCIYVPIHLISDYNAVDMRYILLHELQHYKHKDALTNLFICLAGSLYWFNPFVWYALHEMRCDREIACDTSVLQLLDEKNYIDYGNTLINFAEKISLTPFPYTTGIGSSRQQMKRRILNISTYEIPSFGKKLRGIMTFIMTASVLAGLTPLLSVNAADQCHYRWNIYSHNVSYSDLTSYFEGYEGSFVLYDSENKSWNIYNLDRATTRISPDSTYKIFAALFGLESEIITPNDSLIPWDKTDYPFAEWNQDQTLQSAMQYSVNWYFQDIDNRLGRAAVDSYIHKICYGNENTNADLTTYWLESSLKISPVEQVDLLTSLYRNDWDFSPENIDTVKNSIHITTSEYGKLYGKTGTGRVDEEDINGWFIGYTESGDHTCFFATNITADACATGSKAADITMSILSDMHIWK